MSFCQVALLSGHPQIKDALSLEFPGSIQKLIYTNE